EKIALYYPEVTLRYIPDIEYRLKELSEEFSTVISCDYWHPAHPFQRPIFCPHGQSDKGYDSPILAPYAVQEAVLLYGDLMETMLDELDLLKQIPKRAKIGNFRWVYYQKEKKRLEALAQEKVFGRLERQNRPLLYAPTWRDKDGATSFFDGGQKLIE